MSRLLNTAHPSLVDDTHLRRGFERLFEILDDLQIDAPGAGDMLAAFIARAVVDEILPPSFLLDPLVASMGGEVVTAAKRMLSRDHQYSRLERVWGPGDGRPVAELKVALDDLLQELIVSHDFNEALRCVRELAAPHFHHEVIFLMLYAPSCDVIAHVSAILSPSLSIS